MTRDLAHLTLLTGHVRQSPRSEVAPHVLDALAPIITAGHGTLADLVILLDLPAHGGRGYALGWDDGPAVRCVLCWEAATHDVWWAEALAAAGHTTAALASHALTVPPVPWLAVALLPAAALRCTPDELAMLGDAERCVAWALLDAHPVA